MPEEVEAQMRTMRFPDGRRIPMSVIAPKHVPDPMVGNEPKVGRPEYWFRAIRNIVKAVAVVATKKKSTQYKEDTAQELADRKKHKPLFQGGVEVNIKRNK